MKRIVRKSLAVMAQTIGLWRARRITHAEKLRRLFEALRIETVIDVGANEGHYYDFLRIEVGFAGTIHSVEPASRLAEKMRARGSGDNRWIIHEVALGSEGGELSLNIMAMSEFNSVLEPHPQLERQFADENRIVGSEHVRVERLDDFVIRIPELDLDRTFVKIDTQGFDLEVLRGGSSSLARIPALQTELSLRPVYQGSPHWTKTLEYLETFGFQVSDLFTVTEDSRLRAVELDCLLVR